MRNPSEHRRRENFNFPCYASDSPFAAQVHAAALLTHHELCDADFMHICLFDIDGTLLNTGGAGQRAMEAALQAHFSVDRPVEGISTAGRTDRAITHDLLTYYGFQSDEATWTQFVDAYLQHLPSHLSASTGGVLPGIVELLDQLRSREDVAVGLLTGNLREGAYVKLKHFGLDVHFDFGGFGDTHADRDDVAREAALVVRERFGVDLPAARTWVIGDTPADVKCGRAIGATCVAVATGMYSIDVLRETGPDHLFADFSQPRQFINLLG